jgi:hypothetical protein
MPESKIEIAGASVVRTGSFNPAIFHPEWFANNGLLPRREVDEADVKVVHPQLSNFETERFIIQVTPERLGARCFSSSRTPLRLACVPSD